MDLGLSDSEQLVQRTARSFVARSAGRDQLVALAAGDVGFDRRWLADMVEAGWLGMAVPGAHGGSPATVLQIALVYEELGRGPVPGPWLTSSVLAAGVLSACATPDEGGVLLAAIASGDAIVVPTQWGPMFDGGAATVAPDRGGATGAIRASLPFVPYAAAATHLLVDLPAPPGEDTGRFVVVPRDHPAVTVRRLGGFNPWTYAVELDDLPLVDCTRLTRPVMAGQLERALDVARVVLAAYQVGGCSRVLEMSIEHSATRVQFGVPVGRFQRVQDHVVRIVNARDAARWATYEAIWRLDTGRPAEASVSLAQTLASEGYIEAANAAHEVHAGIGSDPTFGLTLFSAMSRSLYHQLGSPRWHKKRLGRHLAATTDAGT